MILNFVTLLVSFLIIFISMACVYQAGKIEERAGDMFNAPIEVQLKSKRLLFAGFFTSWIGMVAAYHHEVVYVYLMSMM